MRAGEKEQLRIINIVNQIAQKYGCIAELDFKKMIMRIDNPEGDITRAMEALTEIEEFFNK